jgi:hypothetical protein
MDLANLVMYILAFWLNEVLDQITGGKVKIPLNVIHPMSCRLLRYFTDTVRFMSAWIIIAFSIERCFAVWFPLKAASVLSRTRRKLAIAILLFIAMTTNIPVIIYFDVFVQKTATICHYKLDDLTTWESFILVFLNQIMKFYGLPCLFLIALNIFILVGVGRAEDQFKRVADDRSRMEATAERRCLVNLLIVSTVYVLLNLPYVVFWTFYQIERYFFNFASWSNDEFIMIRGIGIFCTSLAVMNYSLNFIIYARSLDYYRSEVKKILRFSICTVATERYYSRSK